jgi:DNA invertase Pin-like site-specific DNA recombinase
MLLGYARVSTAEQSLHLQQDALTAAGCERIYTDVASGARTERGGLEDALGFARAGDTLVVWKLDRLGRSLRHLIDLVNTLHERQVGFVACRSRSTPLRPAASSSSMSSARWPSSSATWSVSGPRRASPLPAFADGKVAALGR